MGTNRLGDPGVDPAQWPPIVERALELGVNMFDTSISYNQGRSEEVVGEVTSRYDVRVYLATKVGVEMMSNAFGDREFSAKTILRDIDGQLKRLRRNRIDMYMLHSPSAEQLDRDDWALAVEQLKKAGKIQWFGVSEHDHASGIRAIELGADLLQVEYDLLSPHAAEELLPLAQRENVGVMVRTPLARGLLTGKFPRGQALSADQQWRRPRGDQLQLRLERVEQLRFLERPGQTLGQAAIRWVLAHPAVHCAVPGARTVGQLEANVAAADGELTAAELGQVKDLHAQWRREGAW